MNEEQKKLMGQRIKMLREKHGFSQDDLAIEMGMNRTNISNYESGRTIPPGNVLTKLADLLKTTSDYILVRTEDPAPHQHIVPEWATSKDKRDFKKMLQEDGEVMFDGVPLDEDDKQRIMDVLTGLFWEAKKMNKRKKK